MKQLLYPTFHINRDDLHGKQLIISGLGILQIVDLKQPLLRLGRVQDGNDIAINVPALSRHHATLQLEEKSYYIIDGQALNGQHHASKHGLYFEGQAINRHKLVNGDVIYLPGRNQEFILLTYLDEEALPRFATRRISLHKKLYIGRGPHNNLILPDPLLSFSHLMIRPQAGGHLVQDLNSSNGTFINGQRIEQAGVRTGDYIQAGGMYFIYNGLELVATNLRRKGIRIEAINLHKQVEVKGEGKNTNHFKTLLDNVSLTIESSEFVAIVGASGAGKSTLLDALNGFRPAEGQVLINGDDLYQNFDAYRQIIGYVPQDDIIHRDLTVQEALKFVAQLRLPPDTTPVEIEQHINHTLKQVAMSDKKQVLIKNLSGGQRKRVNLAVELIADPGILFLDEPTSGLDPGLDKKMMLTLRQLSQSGKTIVLVTHATGNINECDLVAFMGQGGRLVFFGPPEQALSFFRVQTFPSLYYQVEEDARRWQSAFERSKYYETYVKKRQRSSIGHKSQLESKLTNAQERLNTIINSLRQLKILSERNLTLLVRDRRNLLFLLLQSPIIALLLYVIVDAGIFNKGDNTHPDDLINIQTTLFMISCTGTWFGIINSVREIVKELPIYRRERLVNLSIAAYVCCKLLLLLALSIVQAFTLVMIVHSRVTFPSDGVFMPALLEIFLTTLLVTFTSACFGLFLSALMGRENRVITVLPLFLIPQLVFAGIIFTLEGTTKLISNIVFSRWAVEAFGATMNLPGLREAVMTNYGPQKELPFDFSHTAQYLLYNWSILLGFALLSLALTIIALKKQDPN